MTLIESFRPAWANLIANPIRSFFSMLGIVIGTGSVILVVSLVGGSRDAALKAITEGREDMLALQGDYNSSTNSFGRILIEDVERIKKIPSVLTAFPEIFQEIEGRGTFGKATLPLAGIDHEFLNIYDLKMLTGRFFTKEETNARPRVCVISDRVARRIFGYDFPIGQKMRMKEGSLEVIGLFKAEDRLTRMGQRAEVLIPQYTAVQLFSIQFFNSVQIRAKPGQMENVRKAVSDLFKIGESGSSSLAIRDQGEFLKETEEWAQKWLYQLASIAAISLLVGGIGLMNVMLTTVAERTQEIGVRKAIGADSKTILVQFLFESVTLSLLGGTLGVLGGVLMAYALNVFSKGQILVSIFPMAIVASFLFSVITGILFGLFPASKASRLTPVEALRYE